MNSQEKPLKSGNKTLLVAIIVVLATLLVLPPLFGGMGGTSGINPSTWLRCH